jgi:hypothetical protein
VSTLTLSVIATAASTLPNTSILTIVIALGPFGADEGVLAARCRTNRPSAVTDVTACAEFDLAPARYTWQFVGASEAPPKACVYCSVSAAALLPSATAELRSE